MNTKNLSSRPGAVDILFIYNNIFTAPIFYLNLGFPVQYKYTIIIMRMLFSFFIFAALPFFMPEETPVTTPEVLIADSEYCNARYFFCVEYPDALLPNKTISDNGDGIILSSNDNEVIVTISGSRSVLNRRTPDLFDDFISKRMIDNEDGRIIYDIIDGKYYEASFIDGAYHYYQKLFHQGNKYLIYQIVSPIGKENRIDNIRNYLNIRFGT